MASHEYIDINEKIYSISNYDIFTYGLKTLTVNIDSFMQLHFTAASRHRHAG